MRYYLQIKLLNVDYIRTVFGSIVTTYSRMKYNNMTRDKPTTREGLEGLVGDSNNDENQSVIVLSHRSINMQVCNLLTDHHCNL